MRVLIWTENYWIGGCDRFVVDLLDGWREPDVAFALAGNPHPAFDRWLGERVPWALPRVTIPVANLADTPLHRLDVLRAIRRAPPSEDVPATADAPVGASPAADPWRVPIAGLRLGQAALNLARLRSLLRDARPDAVLINNGGYPGGESCRMVALAARGAGVQRVVHFVHNMAYPPAWPPRVERRIDAAIDRATDRWVTAADRASDALARCRGIARERVETVHYGIDAPARPRVRDERLREGLGFVEDAISLAAIANLEQRKGLSVLLEALATLRRQGTRCRAVIVGEGPERARLERETRQLGVEDEVRLLGWRGDVPAILQQADALVLPSLANECLPYVILEAMAWALPVVSTDVAGIPEMVMDGETGFVLPPGDPNGLAAAIARLAVHPDAARDMGAAGRRRLDASFRREAMITAMTRLLLGG